MMSAMGKRLFSRFAYAMLTSTYGDLLHAPQGPEAGVFIRDLLSESFVAPVPIAKGLYLVRHLPAPVRPELNRAGTNDPVLQQLIASWCGERWPGVYGEHWGPSAEDGPRAVYFLTNIVGYDDSTYQHDILPLYVRLVNRFYEPPQGVYLGSADNYLSGPEARSAFDALRAVAAAHSDGLRIELDLGGPTVERFTEGRSAMIRDRSGSPQAFEFAGPYVSVPQEDVLCELQKLLATEPTERTLEDFLVANYAAVFGAKYDRIETQIWLRFPALDLAGRSRRLDLFLRNSVTNDWDLIEVKRIAPLTRTYRDAVVLSAEVTSAMQQLRNYRRILMQDRVKSHFAEMGIQYYEPTLQLVVGRDPQISLPQWRWLVAEQDKIQLLTYDHLLREMAVRLRMLRPPQRLRPG